MGPGTFGKREREREREREEEDGGSIVTFGQTHIRHCYRDILMDILK